MEQYVHGWPERTKTIFNGVLTYSIANILYALLGVIGYLAGSRWMMFYSSDNVSYSSEVYATNNLGLIGIIGIILAIAIIVGFILFIKGLGDFRSILSPADSSSISKIRTAAILILIGSILVYFPFIRWIGNILNIIAFILMIVGYAALRKSGTFPRQARQGANQLFIAMIIGIVGNALGFIPAFGVVITMAANIVVYIMMIIGWNNIKNSSATV